MVLRGLVGALVVLAVLSLVLTVLNLGGVSEAEEEGATILIAKETDWNIEMIDAGPSSQTLRLVIKNHDPILHTFTVSDFDIDEKLTPGSETLIEIKAPRAGSFGFICRVVGHEEDMSGVITFR
jgi:uncharacterized cupredoxin-like copper-binding protein